ncbi:MAG: alpha/beta hydrolase [Actinobacteria bacterium]|nr:alpha/beta hydrolase [Actinomycetota bacterium]
MTDAPDLHRDNVRIASLGRLDIAYETFGNPGDPAILLVMGFGTQMLGYHESMCAELASAGHYVVRFDNRDCGLSTHLETPAPPLFDMVRKHHPPYRIQDFADDAFALADHLELDRFHLVGTSMGGFIAQTMALTDQRRVASLTLVMTSTGSRRVGRPAPKLLLGFARGSSTTRANREASIEEQVSIYREIGSPDLDPDEVRTVAGWSWDRDPVNDGRDRQLAAILAQPDRTRALHGLKVPTLVEHGLADPLVNPSGGYALAKAIPGATFIGHHGRGHDLTRSMWQRLGDDITTHIGRAVSAR